jgi:hypothetical protein
MAVLVVVADHAIMVVHPSSLAELVVAAISVGLRRIEPVFRELVRDGGLTGAGRL